MYTSMLGNAWENRSSVYLSILGKYVSVICVKLYWEIHKYVRCSTHLKSVVSKTQRANTVMVLGTWWVHLALLSTIAFVAVFHEALIVRYLDLSPTRAL